VCQRRSLFIVQESCLRIYITACSFAGYFEGDIARVPGLLLREGLHHRPLIKKLPKLSLSLLISRFDAFNLLPYLNDTEFCRRSLGLARVSSSRHFCDSLNESEFFRHNSQYNLITKYKLLILFLNYIRTDHFLLASLDLDLLSLDLDRYLLFSLYLASIAQ
jgi:hypothetical protein